MARASVPQLYRDNVFLLVPTVVKITIGGTAEPVPTLVEVCIMGNRVTLIWQTP